MESKKNCVKVMILLSR